MSAFTHAHDHHAAPGHRHQDVEMPLSVMARSAAARIGGAIVVLVLVWLAVLWAIALP